jgi:hypothetical protein
MSVAYADARGKNVPLDDSEGQRFAYHVVADSGVLLVMQKLNADPWQVFKELSPYGWREVQGTRFTQFPTSSPGLGGKVSFGSAGKSKNPSGD